MGILSALGFKRNDEKIEIELKKLKETVEEQNQHNVDGIRSDIRTLFSELQSFKGELKDCTSEIEKMDFKISKVAERLVGMDNDMLKVVYKDELDLLRKELSFAQSDIKSIRDSQSQITDKFIDFALNKTEPVIEREVNAPTNKNLLTDFEREVLSKYNGEITSEALVSDTGMSKGHISRTLKGLCEKGFIYRKRKGKEYVYHKK